MEIIIAVLSILVAFIAVILLIITVNKTSYKMLLVKIDESKKNIDFFLSKKEELLFSSIEEIKGSNKKKYSKKDILSDLVKNKNIKLDSYEKDIILKNSLKELREIIEDDEELLKNNKIKNICINIRDVENDLNASKKYFNKTANEIDKLFKAVPKRFMKGILGYKKFNRYSTKKEEEFEILKDK